MPRPSARLDLYLVPPGTQAFAEHAARSLYTDWVRQGVIQEDGLPSHRAETVVPDGFARARVDIPGHQVLYANQLGGFRVTCPQCGVGLARQLRPPDDVRCGRCGTVWAIEDLNCRPPVALGWAALVLVDTNAPTIIAIPANWKVVLRRM